MSKKKTQETSADLIIPWDEEQLGICEPCKCKDCEWWFAGLLRQIKESCGLEQNGKCTVPLEILSLIAEKREEYQKGENEFIVPNKDILARIESIAIGVPEEVVDYLRERWVNAVPDLEFTFCRLVKEMKSIEEDK